MLFFHNSSIQNKFFFLSVGVLYIQPFNLRSFSYFRISRIVCLVGPFTQKSFTSVVLNWPALPPKGASMNFQGGASPYGPYNMESLVNKFTNKHISFYSLFKVRSLNWNKGQLLKGDVVEKRIRTTALHQILHHTLILVHCCLTKLTVSRIPVYSKSIGY